MQGGNARAPRRAAPASATPRLTRASFPAAIAFVLAQLALPATYFLRDDPHDERFAWRMFSTMRVARCQPVLRVGSAPIALSAHFHEAWVDLARRGRRDVLTAMAWALCQRFPGRAVRLDLTCDYVSGRRSHVQQDDVCAPAER